ncbi:conjugal transfer protein, partial [Salmonella enterica subsp. enterica serovar Brunei]|nr:conjugal transfer protein [Salmonella enterica subsp. enterica serovar Brunei]
MTTRHRYAQGLIILALFSPLSGVTAAATTVSPAPPPPSMSAYLS